MPDVRRSRVVLERGEGPLVARLKEQIEGQPDMELVGEFGADPIELLLGVAECRADVVILVRRAAEPEPGVCSHLLNEFPDVTILVLVPLLDRGTIYRKVVARHVVDGLSVEAILGLIRDATGTVA